MANRKIPFLNDEYYHVYNRGVEKRKIFLDEEDYKYFMHILKVFNGNLSAQNTRYLYKNEYRSATSIQKVKPLVFIEKGFLMPNHFHLLIKQISPNGASLFLQRLGVGYTHYFNKKYKRSGVLFQGRSKSKHVEKDNYYQYLKMYLDFNPIDLIEPNWKEVGIKNKKKIYEFLKNYKWSIGNEFEKYINNLGKERLGEIRKIENSL